VERKNKEKTFVPILDKLELLFYYNIISHLNNSLIPEVRAWQSAPLDPSQGRLSLRMQRSEMKQSAFIDLLHTLMLTSPLTPPLFSFLPPPPFSFFLKMGSRSIPVGERLGGDLHFFPVFSVAPW